MKDSAQKPVLVAGATGYVGGRLVPLLLKKGCRVRAFTRSLQKVRSRPWGGHENLEIAQGDMHDAASVARAVEGCAAVYYLVHSMEAQYTDFWEADRHAAYNMVRALKGRRDCRLIYLSGLLPDDPDLSTHLRSRAEVAKILSLADSPVTTLRAAQIIGAGSASFEMLRWLTDRLSIMLTPKWTHVKTQPISITDTLGYLAGVLDHPETEGESYDIGGPDILSYGELINLYAAVAGLRKRIQIPFPWLGLDLSARWISLVTPIPYALARPLLEGMRNEVVCKENRIRNVIPQELTPIRTAIERALGHLRHQTVKSSWFDAGLPSVPEWVLEGDAAHARGSVYTDTYAVRLDASPAEVWRPIVRIGGTTGWYSKNILWKLRGFLDTLMGGPGTRRGRRSGENLFVGDGLDFWRVLDIRPEKRLLLFTEMRLPGEGLLDLQINPGFATGGNPEKGTDLVLSLRFRPRGLLGVFYWYAVSPLHRFVFVAMLKAIAERIRRPVLRGPVRMKRSGRL
ncbi:MAG: SDR family oxidoreductase [Deltaproteobacteria bacterium]|nr:SDR family oxidoreductase [Deltaproteobacteria bacterium]